MSERETPSAARRSKLDRESDDGSGRRTVPETGRPSGALESSSHSDSDDSDRDSDSDASPPTNPRAGQVRNSGGGSMVIRPQNRVTILNFGAIDLEGTTSGVEIGHKTEYLGPVTVQNIVHGVTEGQEFVLSQTVLRARGLQTSSAEGPVASVLAPRRTGLELRSRTAGSGLGERCGKRAGNGLLWKHLLGRKFETSTWLVIALLSFITLMTVYIDSYILAFLHRGREEVPSSYCVISQPPKYPEKKHILQRSRRKHEALPHLQCSMIIPRGMWFANPPKEVTPLDHPVAYVIISHTATEPCSSQAECSMQVLLVQKFHLESRHWSDIGYNFLVGGDGNCYEGRGWEYVGAHSKGYNDVSIGISFIGTFIDVLPPPAQIRACKLLIKEGVSLGKIAPNYKLLGHRQISPTESPGEKLYKELQNWDHWSSKV